MILSPTGLGMRQDAAGDGAYGARRGVSKHNGVDYVCRPGQSVFCPIRRAHMIRIATPYNSDDLNYSGCVIESPIMLIKLFYVDVDPALVGKKLYQGQKIGRAQDITKRYNRPNAPEMTPHIHLQIEKIDPAFLMNLGTYFDAVYKTINLDEYDKDF